MVQTQPGSFGNLGRNALRNPGGSSTGVSLTRTVPRRDQPHVPKRVLQPFQPGATRRPDKRLGRSTFGQILTVGGQRVLQFG
ncbi:MAG: hypothetical protein HY238_22610 [Acidobacteria bacterium]|nr:hypothetical protein [Acidobacteriota bacterium]